MTGVHYSRRHLVGPSGPKAIEMGQAKKKINKGKWFVIDREGIGEPMLFGKAEEAEIEYKRRRKILQEREAR